MTTRNPTQKVLAVFESPASARAAAEEVRQTLDLPAEAVAVGSRADTAASLDAEMAEEAEHTVMGPGNIGPFTPEMQRGIGRWTVVGLVVGAVVVGLLGLIPFADIAAGARVAIGAVVGAAAGASVGFVAGGGFSGDEASLDLLAAERGVPVSVAVTDRDRHYVERLLQARTPIRIDLVSLENAPRTKIATESGTSDAAAR